ncbi:MAG: HAMP domain-containing sensor histidine kinase [Thermodesulfobacteriota bacterium]|nr:HAMP domain-containing sensor histidine kinase [Thermodesulfobacteriota bacterium]
MTECPDLKKICQRVREKSVSYDQYNFSSHFDDFLKAFFDLAQEYDSLEDFYRICVAVPLEMTGLASALYLHDGKSGALHLVCDSNNGVYPVKRPAPEEVILSREPYETGDCYLVPIYSKAPLDAHEGKEQEESKDFQQCGQWDGCGPSSVLGMFSVCPLSDLGENDRFFFAKYTNRIGYNLHNRLIALQNIEHLKFINTLVMDIEHNVIVPNMFFRHLFNQLRKKILEFDNLKDDISKVIGTDKDSGNCATFLVRCDELRADLFSYHQELVKHHANLSLFLESLFRREHFEKGHLVLHPKRCFVEKEIILPQLEHYASRLRSASITVERPRNMLEEEFQILVDIGLLSQVYANLFSNAAKYTQGIITHEGKPRKAVAYGREAIDNFPEPGKKSVKFNVFTTGPHLSEKEGYRIFKEGVRGTDSTNIPGTGHGLSFIRHVVELHGGTVGYEPTSEGNNFYFILPAPPVVSSSLSA